MQTYNGCKPRQPLGDAWSVRAMGKEVSTDQRVFSLCPLSIFSATKKAWRCTYVPSPCVCQNWITLTVIVISLLCPREGGDPLNLKSEENLTFQRMCDPSPHGDSLGKGVKTMNFFSFLASLSWYCYQSQVVEIGWQHKDKNNTDFIVPLRTVIALWVDQVSCEMFPGLSKK